MYSGGFYPFPSPEEYWAWWSRHIYYNRYDVTPGKPYADLLELVMDKNYFVLTTNVDHQFQLLVSIKHGCSTPRATTAFGSAANRAIRPLMITRLLSAG